MCFMTHFIPDLKIIERIILYPSESVKKRSPVKMGDRMPESILLLLKLALYIPRPVEAKNPHRLQVSRTNHRNLSQNMLRKSDVECRFLNSFLEAFRRTHRQFLFAKLVPFH